MVNLIKPSSHFGDLGLIYNRMRLATIIALEKSEFGIIGKQHFNRIFGTIMKQEEFTKTNFIEEFILNQSEVR